MRLIAGRQLTGSYGTVVAGEIFEVEDDLGRQLVLAGNAVKAEPPRILYETKVILPEAPEVSAREPFRHVPVPNPQPTDVAIEVDTVLPEPELPGIEERTADPRGRGRRKGSDPVKY
jgi:hypothetical protein